MTHEAQDNTKDQLPDDLATCHALIEQERARNEELAARTREASQVAPSLRQWLAKREANPRQSRSRLAAV